MRRMLGLWLVLTLLGVAALPLAGTTAAQQPVQGGTLTFAAGADPDSLDPQNTQSNPGEQVNRMMYENLLRFDVKMQLEPALAESWTSSKDGVVWTFKLRKGVKFHDGTPFDAKAVKYFFDRVLGDEKPFKASLYTPVVQAAEVVDDSTVRVTLKQPFGAFLFIMAHSAGGIVSPAAHQKWGKDFTLHPSGTGPFRFVEWVKGDHVTLERNDAYWGGRPNLDRVVVKTVREDQARVLMLESGDADLIVNIPTEEIPRLKKDPRFTIESSPTARALYIAINVKKKPLDDVRVRQALNHAVNREAIVKDLFQNNAQVITGHVAPLQNGYAQLPGYGYDPKKAKELLTQAGHPSLKVKLWSPKGRYVKDYELAQAVQQDLAAVGVEATLSTMEWGAYLAATKTPAEQTDRELFLLGWSPSTGEARWGTFPLLHSSQHAPKGDNRGFFASKALDEAIEKATVAASDQARLGALREAQQIAIKEAPYIFLISPNMVVGTSKKVRGAVNLPLELTYLTEKSWKER
jgi:peptide/nickel transport system substrate-binding protein